MGRKGLALTNDLVLGLPNGPESKATFLESVRKNIKGLAAKAVAFLLKGEASFPKLPKWLF